MTYKNSFKLLFSNFSLVGKVLVFLLINLAIIFGISYVLALPLIDVLANNGWFVQCKEVYNNFLMSLNLFEVVESIGVLFTQFISILDANFSAIYINIILLFATIIILGSFLNGLYSLVICNVLYYFMSDNVKYGFTSSLVSTFYKNVKYNLLSLVTKLPINLSIYVIVLYMLSFLSFNFAAAIVLLFLVILTFLVLKSIKISVFSGWAPALVVFDRGIFNDINKAFKITNRRIFKVFVNAFFLSLTIFVLNVFSAVVTFGVSLLVTIPLSIVLINCFNMISFYSNYGMRYYVDEFNVFVPRKLETTEMFKDIKYKI